MSIEQVCELIDDCLTFSGRLFEGTASEMRSSLQRLSQLNQSSLIWPGMESKMSSVPDEGMRV